MQPIVSPSKEQLRTLRGIIYLIRHRASGKCYVGQSRRTFRWRYGLDRWWKKVASPHLKHSIAKYGAEAFEITILEHSVVDKIALNAAEERWAKSYDAYHPKGYNLAPCGQESIETVSPEYRYRSGNKIARPFRVKEVATGIIHEGVNFTKFCRERGLHREHLWTAMKEKGRVVNGFCAIETTEEDIKARRFLSCNPDMRLPMSIWKDGAEYVVHEPAMFAKTHGLNKALLVKLLKKGIPSYRGFGLCITPTPKRHRKFEWVELINEAGQIFHIKSLYRFCKDNGLNEPQMYEIANGVAKSRYGYRLHNVKLLD